MAEDDGDGFIENVDEPIQPTDQSGFQTISISSGIDRLKCLFLISSIVFTLTLVQAFQFVESNGWFILIAAVLIYFLYKKFKQRSQQIANNTPLNRNND
jgi:hypothetical protein